MVVITVRVVLQAQKTRQLPQALFFFFFEHSQSLSNIVNFEASIWRLVANVSPRWSTALGIHVVTVLVSNRKLQVSVTKLMTLKEVMSDRDSEDVITFQILKEHQVLHDFFPQSLNERRTNYGLLRNSANGFCRRFLNLRMRARMERDSCFYGTRL